VKEKGSYMGKGQWGQKRGGRRGNSEDGCERESGREKTPKERGQG
jgi:hypothetical protein